MDMITGTCEFCGQQKMVQAESEAEANRITTEECGCEEGKDYRMKEACLDRIVEILKTPRPEANVMPMLPVQCDFVREAADMVAIEALDGVDISYQGTVIKLRHGTRDKPAKLSWKQDIVN
jgi:hypothetical protein